jgi:hypothetical protein
MLSVASLQRTGAVFGLLLLGCYGEIVWFTHSDKLVPGLAGRVLGVIFASGLLGFFSWLTRWERRRRKADEAAVARVVEAARSVGAAVPQDRAIFPVFYRGRRNEDA